MEIKQVKISELKPYEKNNKIHNKKQIDLLKKSIQEFGFTNPILLSEDNSIIGGHGRLEAIKKLGWTEVPCIYVKDLTEKQIRKLRLLDNKLAELAEDNIEAIKFELDKLQDLELDKLYINLGEVDELDYKDISEKIKEDFQILVNCNNEIEQQEIYEKLQTMNLNINII